MDADALVTLVSGTAGALTTLVFFVVAFIKGWIVPGFIYLEMKLDRDYWRSLADRIVTTTEHLVQPLQRPGGG